MLFFPIFSKGIKAKLNDLESESDIFPQNEGKVGKSELTPVVKALTNCAMVLEAFQQQNLTSHMINQLLYKCHEFCHSQCYQRVSVNCCFIHAYLEMVLKTFALKAS